MWVSSKTTTPVALMRTTWDYQQGLSIALKGGTAQSGHTHLDAGSFIFISKDTRWSTDLGPQDYNSLVRNLIVGKCLDTITWLIIHFLLTINIKM